MHLFIVHTAQLKNVRKRDTLVRVITCDASCGEISARLKGSKWQVMSTPELCTVGQEMVCRTVLACRVGVMVCLGNGIQS